jgi:voltage-gated potassium channel
MRWLLTLTYSPVRNLAFGALFVVGVALLGVVAYVAHGWSLGDSLYMVVITIFTVGFEEVRPIDTPGLRAVTITLVVTGCTGMIFLTGALVQAITLSQVQAIFGLNRMTKQIEHLQGHIIVCGFGRTGSMLSRELRAAKTELVILELDPQRCAEAREMGFLCMQADAAEEAVLVQAGIHRARALATVVASDAVNVFITLSARALNADLQIVARGELPATERKLLQAGANSVVMPAHIGAEQVASVLLFPAIAGMIQSSERRRQMEMDLRSLGLEIEVVLAAEGSRYVDRTVEEIEQMAERTFFIVAIEHAGSGKIDRPSPQTRVRSGDGITLLGRGGRAEMVSRFDGPELG